MWAVMAGGRFILAVGLRPYQNSPCGMSLRARKANWSASRERRRSLRFHGPPDSECHFSPCLVAQVAERAVEVVAETVAERLVVVAQESLGDVPGC